MINPLKVAGVVIAGLFVFFIALGGFYTVDQGYRGVILRTGAFVGIAEPGLGFKFPIFDRVVDISVKDHSALFDGGGSGLQSYSYDQQTAGIRVSVNYSIPVDKVGEVYSRFGGHEGLVNTALNTNVFNSVKEAFGQFTALKAVQDRNGLGLSILNNLKEVTAEYPINIKSVQIENIDFSDEYENSIEARMMAEIEVQKIRQNAEREKVNAEIVVIQANAAAEAVLANATAQAKATTLKGEAEASAIKAKGDALAANPSLVALIQAEKWDGALPTTMVPDSTVPMLGMNKTVIAPTKE